MHNLIVYAHPSFARILSHTIGSSNWPSYGYVLKHQKSSGPILHTVAAAVNSKTPHTAQKRAVSSRSRNERRPRNTFSLSGSNQHRERLHKFSDDSKLNDSLAMMSIFLSTCRRTMSAHDSPTCDYHSRAFCSLSQWRMWRDWLQ